MKIQRMLRRIVYLSIIILILGVIFFTTEILFAEIWQLGGELIPSPSANIISTAEYLYINPMPTPIDIYTHLNSEYDGICVSDSNLTYTELDIFWDRWFLNGSRVPHDAYTLDYYENWILFCIRPSYVSQLRPGLHLVEVEFNASPFWKEFSYQFAIKIEPSPTPSPTPSAP
jgi:hypothetical protein